MPSSLSSPMWSRLDRSRMRFIQCERDALSPARAASFILIHVHDNRALVARVVEARRSHLAVPLHCG